MQPAIYALTVLPFLLCMLSLAQTPAPETVPDEPTTQPASDAKDDNWASERIVYKKEGDRELSLYVVKPDVKKFPGKRPGIVFFHGGGWNQGQPKQMAPQCRELAKRGMVAISAEYRLHARDNVTLRDCIIDAFTAFRYVRENADKLGIDPDRLAAGGGSAGGHLAATLATVDVEKLLPKDEAHPAPKDWKVYRPDALVLFNPVYDVNPDGGYYVLRIIGKDWKPISPAHNLHKEMPPTLVMLGDQDKLIPVATAERFRDGMKALGVRSDLKIYKGQGHGFFNGPGREETTRDMVEFLMSLGFVEGEK